MTEIIFAIAVPDSMIMVCALASRIHVLRDPLRKIAQ